MLSSVKGFFNKRNSLFDLLIVLFSIVISNYTFSFFQKFFHNQTVNFSVDNGNLIFQSKSIFLSYIINFLPFSIFYIISSLGFIIYFKKYFFWKNILKTSHLKWTLFFICSIFVYNIFFSEYNFFNNNSYLIDKSILVLLWLSLITSPWGLSLFLPLIFLFFSSYEYPLGYFSYTDKTLPLNVIIYSFVILGIYPLAKKIKYFNLEDNWIRGVLILTASSYFAPFLGKVEISPNLFDWFLIEEFSLNFQKYFERTWLINYSEEYYYFLTEFLIKYDNYLLLVAFLIEMLGVFILIKSRISVLVILLFSVLNILIYSLSAIFFWKWILSNIAIVIYLIIRRPKVNFEINFLWIVLIIYINSNFFGNNVKLRWYSNPYHIEYSIKVKSNNEYFMVNPADLNPYDIFFTFENRWNINNSLELNSYTDDFKETEYLKNLSLEQILNYQTQNGICKFKPHDFNNLLNFLKIYFQNFNNNLEKKNKIHTSITHIDYRVKNKFLFDKKVSEVIVLSTDKIFNKRGKIYSNEKELFKIIF